MSEELDWDTRMALEDESSLLIWYPRVKDVLKTPRTEILRLTKNDIRRIHLTTCSSMDGNEKHKLPKKLIKEIQECAAKIGYPLFMRSDQGSGKHEWHDTCYVTEEADLIGHLLNLNAWHEMAGMMGMRYSALVFREFVTLRSCFTAFNGMPVARERRYFVRDGEVVCHHPYWVEEAIRNPCIGGSVPADWKRVLAGFNSEHDEEVRTLTSMAVMFAKVSPGYWSVDFAQGMDGTWWLIDAARGEISWHPDDCPHNPHPAPPKKMPKNLDDMFKFIGEDEESCCGADNE